MRIAPAVERRRRTYELNDQGKQHLIWLLIIYIIYLGSNKILN